MYHLTDHKPGPNHALLTNSSATVASALGMSGYMLALYTSATFDRVMGKPALEQSQQRPHLLALAVLLWQ